MTGAFKYWVIFIFLLFYGQISFAQPTWFIDGYHGGIYGHLPSWQTKFMVDKMNQFPDWKINLEIEPESWDSIAVHDDSSYHAFQQLFADQSSKGRIEYVNPAYGQSYLYNISGESIIRQFQTGMKKLRTHFPGAIFSSYSSEEPCFTSALPSILSSLGFKYASLKNPNTCWGGYTRAYGGELVNWIGPDGTSLITVPRYEVEALKPHSIWETIAASNSSAYIEASRQYGIAHPVGMTLQDAGWKFGPWMRGAATNYETWRGYIENVSTGKPDRDWKFSQEDLLVSLMWGSQVLQRIAQAVRFSEYKIIQAEKMAAMERMYRASPWPGASLDEAWRTLLLSQHHDCWIVPYNGKPGDTWADKVNVWTTNTNARSEEIIGIPAAIVSDKLRIRIYNTTGNTRQEYVRLPLPAGWALAQVTDRQGHIMPSQLTADSGLLIKANVPSMGFTTFLMQRGHRASLSSAGKAHISRLSDGRYVMQTDLYRILLDPAKGGIIKSWLARQLGNKELVASNTAPTQGFNELRGNFYNQGGFRSSAETPATLRIIENGPFRIELEIKGEIAGNPFIQTIRMEDGQPRVDASLVIDWKDNPAIGEYFEVPKNDQVRKAYYDDRFKLLALFPVRLSAQKIFKNAPFDVTESHLPNTFFNRWDSIKNNVLLNWVDVEDGAGRFGVALFCDHTTSYAHGENYPLGLTVQYSGNGIFYRDYKVKGPTTIHYAWIPHAGRWDKAGIWTAGVNWNEPLLVKVTGPSGGDTTMLHSFLHTSGIGWELTSAIFSGDDLFIRFFNAEGDGAPQKIYLGLASAVVSEVELSGKWRKDLPIRQEASGERYVMCAMPRFGFRTIRCTQIIRQ